MQGDDIDNDEPLSVRYWLRVQPVDIFDVSLLFRVLLPKKIRCCKTANNISHR